MRKHQRTSLKTEIWLGQDGIFTKKTEVLRDLSEGGAFIETSQRFALGSVLSMRFGLPGVFRHIACTVAVRHFGCETGLGVQFLDMSADDQTQLRCFLQSTYELV